MLAGLERDAIEKITSQRRPPLSICLKQTTAVSRQTVWRTWHVRPIGPRRTRAGRENAIVLFLHAD